jgi:hypothetical protein
VYAVDVLAPLEANLYHHMKELVEVENHQFLKSPMAGMISFRDSHHFFSSVALLICRQAGLSVSQGWGQGGGRAGAGRRRGDEDAEYAQGDKGWHRKEGMR